MTEEARDNYKFLRTVERHFRAIATGAVSEIAGVLTPMFTALRLVWAISTYYSDDTHMGLLMQRIAHDIAERVERSISIQVAKEQMHWPLLTVTHAEWLIMSLVWLPTLSDTLAAPQVSDRDRPFSCTGSFPDAT